jgi:hypothetical protein
VSGIARAAASASLVAFSVAAWSAPAARHAPASAPTPTTTRPAAAAAPAPAASAATEFSGPLVTGVTYVADMFFDTRALHVWRPTRDVLPGKNVAWTIAWTNLDEFPALKTAATQSRPQRFRFRVVRADMLSGSPQLPWMATYRCEVLAVEPLPVAAPKQARRR